MAANKETLSTKIQWVASVIVSTLVITGAAYNYGIKPTLGSEFVTKEAMKEIETDLKASDKELAHKMDTIAQKIDDIYHIIIEIK